MLREGRSAGIIEESEAELCKEERTVRKMCCIH